MTKKDKCPRCQSDKVVIRNVSDEDLGEELTIYECKNCYWSEEVDIK